MSKPILPPWQERQRLLHPRDKNLINVPRLVELGHKAMDQGFLQDAFEYFQAAKFQEGLEKIKDISVKDGDVFLLTALEKLGSPFDNEIWNKAGYRAFELGRYKFAKTAFERTQNELMLAKVAATTGESKDAPAAA